jgi:hypothetical protein
VAIIPEPDNSQPVEFVVETMKNNYAVRRVWKGGSRLVCHVFPSPEPTKNKEIRTLGYRYACLIAKTLQEDFEREHSRVETA